ncbi:hypothetical protein WOLCODRAFT_157525 [Wolfiporia cocos MD-104 SS10]|uniref:Uncharacterized protein n=1 Tax=Wolfiporia cocos (strain MD-104) TaxID=742152 RepID=A0A2H3JAJ2_WOLCO|nr:hypothetical protein WOLCODRAFT_157525 [Wolfiporia cocos MD-104 SS10]
MSTPPLTPQARRVRTIMVTIPIIFVTSFVLYKRLVLGEPRRMLPRDDPSQKILQVKGAEGIRREEVWGDAGGADPAARTPGS